MAIKENDFADWFMIRATGQIRGCFLLFFFLPREQVRKNFVTFVLVVVFVVSLWLISFLVCLFRFQAVQIVNGYHDHLPRSQWIDH